MTEARNARIINIKKTEIKTTDQDFRNLRASSHLTIGAKETAMSEANMTVIRSGANIFRQTTKTRAQKTFNKVLLGK
jgi:hypothetical protein